MYRDILDNLEKWKNQPRRQPLILMGARQVGKTFILKEFGRKYFSGNCHYLNFEREKAAHQIFKPDLNPHRIINELEFYFRKSINLNEDLLILDEIQDCPLAITSLKYFCENLPELAICSAGSLLGLQLNPTSVPVGKVNILSMYPCTFREFLGGIGDNRALEALQKAIQTKKLPDIAHNYLWEQFKNYLIVGGLPEVIVIYNSYHDRPFVAHENVRKRQRELITAYQADIAKHSGKVNAMHIDRVWRSVPEQLSAVQDETAQKFKFKDVVPGIRGFNRLAPSIDWLLKAGLILQVKIVNSGHLPSKAYSKENMFKLMMFDVGVLGAMVGLTPQVILNYDYGTYKGYFAENFVGQELVANGTRELFSWREGAAEIEYLLEFNGHPVPVEVKSGSKTRSKSLASFSQKYAPHLKVVLSGKNIFICQETMTHYYPLYLSGSVFSMINTR